MEMASFPVIHLIVTLVALIGANNALSPFSDCDDLIASEDVTIDTKLSSIDANTFRTIATGWDQTMKLRVKRDDIIHGRVELTITGALILGTKIDDVTISMERSPSDVSAYLFHKSGSALWLTFIGTPGTEITVTNVKLYGCYARDRK